MSMKHYAVRDYGVLINEEELSKKYFDVYENNNEIEDLYLYCDFNGEAIMLNSCDFDSFIPNELFFFGSAERVPGIFTKAYNDYSELKTELKNKYSKFVNEDFPWDNRIVELYGTIFG